MVRQPAVNRSIAGSNPASPAKFVRIQRNEILLGGTGLLAREPTALYVRDYSRIRMTVMIAAPTTA